VYKNVALAGLRSPDGDDLGEATYAQMIRPGEEIHLGAGQRFRVVDVVPFEEDTPLELIRRVKPAVLVKGVFGLSDAEAWLEARRPRSA